VPYKGEALGYNDLVAGQIQLMVGNIAGAVPFVNAGKLRALAVTSATRSKLLPDIPTVAESGLPGYESSGWFGLMAPAGTPAPVIEKIQRDTARLLDTTEMRARLFVQGMTPLGNTPAEFGRAIEKESAHWARVVGDRKLIAN
jgi:tripartite-type tricarboxylate transporter receptor subunit TctC